MSDELKQPQLRAFQYFYSEGSFELGFGLMSVLLSIYFFFEKRLEGTWLAAILDSSLILVLIGGAALVRWLMKKLKERVTYPRTGYVSYRREGGRKRGVRLIMGLVMGGLIGAGVTILVTQPIESFDAMPFISGLLMGIVFVILAWRTVILRFYLFAGFSTLCGVGLAFVKLGNYPALSIFYLALGAAMIMSGLVILAVYLRRNPVIAED